MKNLGVIFSLILFFSGTAFSQDRSALTEKIVSEYTTLYSLDEGQQEQMRVIENRRLNNLEEIAPLEQTDYRLFLQKKRALRVNTQGSIRRMLVPEQRLIHNQQLVEYRKETSDLIQQMRKEGKSKEELELLMLERG